MMMPLYRNDGVAAVPLSPFQRTALATIRRKIANRELVLVSNRCICAAPGSERDVVVSEKDRYGLPIRMLLCARCGLIRSEQIFDPPSTVAFYQSDYRSLYIGSKQPPEAFFENQVARGRRLFEVFQAYAPERLGLVFEAGCGAGGILHAFRGAAQTCAGCDFDPDYLDFGLRRGLQLVQGDFQDRVADGSVDLLILCQVLEHFTDPIRQAREAIRKLKPGGYLLIEVPGILNIHRFYFNPILYFQNAHCFNFTAAHLRVFFSLLGMKVLHGDETALFLLRKPIEWVEPEVDSIFDATLNGCADRVRRYLIRAYLLFRFRLNPYEWRLKLRRAIRNSPLSRLRRRVSGRSSA